LIIGIIWCIFLNVLRESFTCFLFLDKGDKN
jgi:hypothetical protein